MGNLRHVWIMLDHILSCQSLTVHALKSGKELEFNILTENSVRSSFTVWQTASASVLEKRICKNVFSLLWAPRLSHMKVRGHSSI